MPVDKQGCYVQDEISNHLADKSCLPVPLKCFEQFCCNQHWNLSIPLPSPHR